MDSIKIIGGGLSGCLLLAALKHRWPELQVTLCERSGALSDRQTWSFHSSDVPEGSWSWLRPYITKEWSGYDVFFPKYQRHFSSGYNSIRAEDLAYKIQSRFAKNILLNTEVTPAANHFITTGWSKLGDLTGYGFQKFVGLDLRLKVAHGLNRPILKDVRCPQTDGYRFFYVLPFSETELMIEDTYYSNSPQLDVLALKENIFNYAKKNNWSLDSVLREESGSLPLQLRPKPLNDLNSLVLGAAAELAHPVTGYTFPTVIRQIQSLAESPVADITTWKKILSAENKKIQRPFAYYGLLNRMLFRAAGPDQRYKILERFYTLPTALIERFYGGRTTYFDQFRILMGKPPVPIYRALKQL